MDSPIYIRTDDRITRVSKINLSNIPFFAKLFSIQTDKYNGSQLNPYIIDMDYKTLSHIIEFSRYPDVKQNYCFPKYVQYLFEECYSQLKYFSALFDEGGLSLENEDSDEICYLDLISINGQCFQLDVGNNTFYTSIKTLIRCEYFNSLIKNWNQTPGFLDRNGKTFKYILSLLRNKKYPFPEKYKDELLFFGLSLKQKNQKNKNQNSNSENIIIDHKEKFMQKRYHAIYLYYTNSNITFFKSVNNRYNFFSSGWNILNTIAKNNILEFEFDKNSHFLADMFVKLSSTDNIKTGYNQKINKISDLIELIEFSTNDEFILDSMNATTIDFIQKIIEKQDYKDFLQSLDDDYILLNMYPYWYSQIGLYFPICAFYSHMKIKIRIILKNNIFLDQLHAKLYYHSINLNDRDLNRFCGVNHEYLVNGFETIIINFVDKSPNFDLKFNYPFELLFFEIIPDPNSDFDKDVDLKYLLIDCKILINNKIIAFIDPLISNHLFKKIKDIPQPIPKNIFVINFGLKDEFNNNQLMGTLFNNDILTFKINMKCSKGQIYLHARNNKILQILDKKCKWR